MLLLPLSVWNITEMYKTERSNVLLYFFLHVWHARVFFNHFPLYLLWLGSVLLNPELSLTKLAGFPWGSLCLPPLRL